MPLPTIPSGNVASALGGGFKVANSCRFDRGSNPHMTKTQSDGDRDKWTYSCWFKLGSTFGAIRYLLTAKTDGSNYVTIEMDSANRIRFGNLVAGSYNGFKKTNEYWRDVGAWMHIVCVYDSENANAAHRMRVYINGTEITSWATDTATTLNQDSAMNYSSADVRVGNLDGESSWWDGYMAEVCLVDGSALAPTSFGEFDTDGSPTIWKPIDVSGLTFGTNGFYLDFEDSSNLGNDANGGTDLTETNLDATDSATDTPTNNFCTLNPLFKSGAFTSSTGAVVLSQGNCHLAEATHAVVCGTMGVTRGKWYWEVKMNGNDYPFGVLGTEPAGNASHSYNDSTAYGIYIESSGGNTITAGNWSGSAIYTGNATYMIAIDVDNNKLWCGKDGSWTGDPAAGSGNSVTLGTHEYAPWFHSAGTAGDNSASVNFGGCAAFTVSSSNSDGNGYGNFEYAVPSGFFSLCTKNLAEYG